MALVMSVSFPVFMAGGRKAWVEMEFGAGEQPRAHSPHKRDRRPPFRRLVTKEMRAGSGNIRFAFDGPSAIRGQEFAESFARGSANAGAAMRQFVRPGKHLEIFFGIKIGPGFEQNAVEAPLGKNLRGDTTAGAGTDDANVVLFGGADH